MKLDQSDLSAIKEIVDGAVSEFAGYVKTTIADKMATKEDLQGVEQRLSNRVDSVEEQLGAIAGDVKQIQIDVTTANNRLGNIEASIGDLRATDDGIVDALARKKILSESEAQGLRHRKPTRHAAAA